MFSNRDGEVGDDGDLDGGDFYGKAVRQHGGAGSSEKERKHGGVHEQ